jgi:hypothetical protein
MSKKHDFEKIKENYFALVTDEIEFGIVTALNWFESLNLKKLAVMLDKPESTTLRYIRKLKDIGIIVFDSKKSEDSWGKFYKLSPQIKKTYDAYMHAMDDQIERIEEEIRDKIDSEEELEEYTMNRILSEDKLKEIPLQQHYFHFVSKLQSIMMNEAVNKIEEFLSKYDIKDIEKIKPKIKLSPTDISVYVSSLKINKWNHIFRINNLIFSFLKDIDELKKTIEQEMEEENVPDDQKITHLVNVFTGNHINFEILD